MKNHPDQRTRWMRDFIESEHFRYRRFAADGPRSDEAALSSEHQLQIEAPKTDLLQRMAADFRRFCEVCMNIRLPSAVFDRADGPATSPRVRWRLSPKTTGANRIHEFSRLERDVESFIVDVSETETLIQAGHERGLLHGTHHLEWLMAGRGAPWLTKGRIERAPRFAPRISNGIFIHADQKVDDPDAFSDEYLSLMSHFGANGIHLHVHLWDFCRNAPMPEMNSLVFEQNVQALNDLADRAAAHGIDLYLYLATRIFSETHPVFQNHPDARGAKLEFMLEGQYQFNLCSGSERVLACYEETLENLFRAAPKIAGAIIIVGGEGFFHCHTRPVPPYEGSTNCPNCKNLDPSDQVARLANRCAAAIRRTGTNKLVFVWPYSAFAWSGEDRAQIRMIERLSDDVNLLSNFDTGSEDRVNGDGVFLFDYNIKSIGPSEIFAAQARRCVELQRPVFCKTETNTTPDAFFLPYVPVHHRWHQRFQSIGSVGVAGFIGQWRFYGMNGSPPEELQNARRILPILARDPRIGYGHCYGIVYDQEMVERKISHCEHLLAKELPRFSSQVRFHIWHDHP
ncbi:MAG: hypothetical protein HY360_11605 [Verrucomicrobia bacterium]|nr:hypothetical protein [Verrucomicrobiota bacterium]